MFGNVGIASDVSSTGAIGGAQMRKWFYPNMTHPSVFVADVHGIIRGVVEDGVALAWSAEDAAHLRVSISLGVEREHPERAEET